jgi:hypothetical protein
MNRFARGEKIGAKMTSRREPDRTMRMQLPAELQPRDAVTTTRPWLRSVLRLLAPVEREEPQLCRKRARVRNSTLVGYKLLKNVGLCRGTDTGTLPRFQYFPLAGIIATISSGVCGSTITISSWTRK